MLLYDSSVVLHAFSWDASIVLDLLILDHRIKDLFQNPRRTIGLKE